MASVTWGQVEHTLRVPHESEDYICIQTGWYKQTAIFKHGRSEQVINEYLQKVPHSLITTDKGSKV